MFLGFTLITHYLSFTLWGRVAQLFNSRLTIPQAIINDSILELIKCCEMENRSFFFLFWGDDLKTFGFKIQYE